MKMSYNINDISAHKNTNIWYEYSTASMNVKVETKQDDHNYYFRIIGQSTSNDLIIDDIHKLPKKDFKDLEDEVKFYDYLRCLIQLTISDLKISFENIYVVGPSGLVNCKFNDEQNEAEKFYFKNLSSFYDTPQTRFLGFINSIMGMEEIIKTSRTESYNPLKLFGCNILNFQPRRIKHGDFKIKMESLDLQRRNKSSYYVPPKDICDIYKIDSERKIHLYRALLDEYILKGEDHCRKNFFCTINYKKPIKSENQEWLIVE